MKILALDTTGLVASVALVDENKTIAEFTTNYKKTHSQTIMPMIEELVKMVDLDLKDVDYIACSSGPGSFTGLRIGAATAKGLACDIKELLDKVIEIDENAIFLGDGVPVFKEKISEFNTGFKFAPQSANMQRAACVGTLAMERIDEAISPNDFEILYLRKSQAERELEEKNANRVHE